MKLVPSKKTILIQSGILLCFLLLLEFFFRLSGDKPGVLRNELFPIDTIIHEPLFRVDEYGISSYVENSPHVPESYTLNKQGFRSTFNYDKGDIDSLRSKDDRKIIFLVGDSYTQGCCAQSIDSSFADLLVKNSQHHILNFGIGAVNLVQYRQIVKKYVPKLKPNLVVVPFYLGNDIAYYERSISTEVPFCYAVKNYAWLNSEIPSSLRGQDEESKLKSVEEAYYFYLDNFTLWGKNANIFERTIRHSVVLSKIYLGIRYQSKVIPWALSAPQGYDGVETTNRLLKEIDQICTLHNTRLLVVGIPAPNDVKNQDDLSEEYGVYFNGIHHRFPDISNYSLQDYDGEATSNHFLNSGHLKFYHFIHPEIKRELNEMKTANFISY